MKLKDFDHVVWDFNGTILDDVAIGIRAVNLLLSRRGIPTIPDEAHYREVFGFPIEDYYRRIGFDFTKESYDTVAHEWVREYRLIEGEAPLREGVLSLMELFRERGVPQSVLSATKTEQLVAQLRGLGILSYFDSVSGNDNIYAASKTEMVKAWAARRAPGRVLMIGDTEHDASTAYAAGFTPVLVSGGHAGDKELFSAGCAVYPDFMTLGKELL